MDISLIKILKNNPSVVLKTMTFNHTIPLQPFSPPPPPPASHVRRVRVPSQASDVDQFLDDLFMPVLNSQVLDRVVGLMNMDGTRDRKEINMIININTCSILKVFQNLLHSK